MSPAEIITRDKAEKLEKWILKKKGGKIVESISKDDPSIIYKTCVVNNEPLVQIKNLYLEDAIVLRYTSKQETELKEKRIIHSSRHR